MWAIGLRVIPCFSIGCMQDGKHLAILTDILEDDKAQLSLKVAVCTILRAAAQADAVSMSALTQARPAAPSHDWCCLSQLAPPAACALTPSHPSHSATQILVRETSQL